jgi:hydrogenase/urease accessory protein HupE
MKSVPSLALHSSGYFLVVRVSSLIFNYLLRFAGFLLSCVGISLAAARGRGIKGGAALLGVV